MWQGKLKALTFSFDDGVIQDRRFVGILNKYGLHGTFNLNSAKLGYRSSGREVNGHTVYYSKVEPSEIRELYRGHEIASHTLAHPDLLELSDENVIRQVEEDRRMLSKLAGYEVIGFAYPYGSYDERIIKLIRENTGIKYARATGSPRPLDLDFSEPLAYQPTNYFVNTEEMIHTAKMLIEMKPEKPQLMYVWGHTYQLDEATQATWDDFEEFCALISGKDDIFYGTNAEVFADLL